MVFKNHKNFRRFLIWSITKQEGNYLTNANVVLINKGHKIKMKFCLGAIKVFWPINQMSETEFHHPLKPESNLHWLQIEELDCMNINKNKMSRSWIRTKTTYYVNQLNKFELI